MDLIDEIEARAARATAPPWNCDGGGYIAIVATVDGKTTQIGRAESFGPLSDEQVEANADFLTKARTDIPALCATVKHLRAENELLKSQRMIVRDDAERFIKQYLHSAQWEGERLMITFENETLIAALIGDVEKL